MPMMSFQSMAAHRTVPSCKPATKKNTNSRQKSGNSPFFTSLPNIQKPKNFKVEPSLETSTLKKGMSTHRNRGNPGLPKYLDIPYCSTPRSWLYDPEGTNAPSLEALYYHSTQRPPTVLKCKLHKIAIPIAVFDSPCVNWILELWNILKSTPSGLWAAECHPFLQVKSPQQQKRICFTWFNFGHKFWSI